MLGVPHFGVILKREIFDIKLKLVSCAERNLPIVLWRRLQNLGVYIMQSKLARQGGGMAAGEKIKT